MGGEEKSKRTGTEANHATQPLMVQLLKLTPLTLMSLCTIPHACPPFSRCAFYAIVAIQTL